VCDWCGYAQPGGAHRVELRVDSATVVGLLLCLRCRTAALDACHMGLEAARGARMRAERLPALEPVEGEGLA
jgi:hypothetical protein